MPPTPRVTPVATLPNIPPTGTVELTSATSSVGTNPVYYWTLVEKPPGSTASLSASSTAGNTILSGVDKRGTYIVFLSISDDSGSSHSTHYPTQSALQPYGFEAPLSSAFGVVRVAEESGLVKPGRGEYGWLETGLWPVFDSIQELEDSQSAQDALISSIQDDVASLQEGLIDLDFYDRPTKTLKASALVPPTGETAVAVNTLGIAATSGLITASTPVNVGLRLGTTGTGDISLVSLDDVFIDAASDVIIDADQDITIRTVGSSKTLGLLTSASSTPIQLKTTGSQADIELVVQGSNSDIDVTSSRNVAITSQGTAGIISLTAAGSSAKVDISSQDISIESSGSDGDITIKATGSDGDISILTEGTTGGISISSTAASGTVVVSTPGVSGVTTISSGGDVSISASDDVTVTATDDVTISSTTLDGIIFLNSAGSVSILASGFDKDVGISATGAGGSIVLTPNQDTTTEKPIRAPGLTLSKTTSEFKTTPWVGKLFPNAPRLQPFRHGPGSDVTVSATVLLNVTAGESIGWIVSRTSIGTSTVVNTLISETLASEPTTGIRLLNVELSVKCLEGYTVTKIVYSTTGVVAPGSTVTLAAPSTKYFVEADVLDNKTVYFDVSVSDSVNSHAGQMTVLVNNLHLEDVT